jgi:pimeloyl-ACP methyl ester carboxylesterase
MEVSATVGDIQLPGISMHYRTWGDSSDPPVVILHGAFLSGGFYDEIAKILVKKHRARPRLNR